MVVRLPALDAGVLESAYFEVRLDAVPKRLEVEFKARTAQDQVGRALVVLFLNDPTYKYTWAFTLSASGGITGLEQTRGPTDYWYPKRSLDTSAWHRYEVTVSFEEQKIWVRMDGTEDVYVGALKAPAESQNGATFATVFFGAPYYKGPAPESRTHYDDIVVRSFP